MAIIQSGLDSSLLTVTSAGVALVANCRPDGEPEHPTYSGEYFAGGSMRFTAALASSSAIFALRNGASKVMRIMEGQITLSFDGTAAASSFQASLRRFTTATPTGGTAITVVLEHTTDPASTVADARIAAAGTALTTTGLVIGAPIYNAILPRGATGGVANFVLTRDVVLEPNEGILIQYDAVGVIGDGIAATFYWGEA